MGQTAAVRRAETWQRQEHAPGLRMDFCPLMFTSGLIAGIPYFSKPQGGAQVINVPVRAAGMIDMVIDASLQPPRSESTADIDIKSGFEDESAKFADVDRFFNRGS